jgi:hypothetical protein
MQVRSTLPSAKGADAEFAEAVLHGDVHPQDRPNRPDLVGIQDYAVRKGQGHVADREPERLGRSDMDVILLRNIWTLRLLQASSGGDHLDTDRAEPVTIGRLKQAAV